MKTVGLMTAITAQPGVRRLAQRVAARFERLHNMPVHIITEEELAGRPITTPHFARYYMWELLPADIERVVYFDYDILHLRPLPPLPEVDFAACRDQAAAFTDVQQYWPVVKRAGVYVNTGFFIATRRMEPVFRRVLYNQTTSNGGGWPWFWDQTYLNVELFAAIEEGTVTFKPLSARWSSLVIMDPQPTDDPYALHFAGMEQAEKLALIDAMLDAIDTRERSASSKTTR